VTYSRSMVFSGYSDFLHQQTDFHDIAEIVLKMVFKTITSTLFSTWQKVTQ